MALQPNNNRIARFGVFELDLIAGELRKGGVKMRLQGQPIQVLTLLLERAGEVVTREELRQKLWASDTFVDFDHSLNTAINKVRETLRRLRFEPSLCGDSCAARIPISSLPCRLRSKAATGQSGAADSGGTARPTPVS